jgi:hypothetical protein
MRSQPKVNIFDRSVATDHPLAISRQLQDGRVIANPQLHAAASLADAFRPSHATERPGNFFDQL